MNNEINTNNLSSKSPDLTVNLAGLRMKNPLTTASGTSGYGPELNDYLDLSQLGAFTTKSITLEPRQGNPPPRIVETRCGVINSIGLANVGLEKFITDKLPQTRKLDVPVIVNVAGKNPDEYVKLAAELDKQPHIDMLEINISCPNVAAGGLEFGADTELAKKLISTIRQEVTNTRLAVKLTPNVTDITQVAQAAVDGGADVLTLINTVKGMAVDVESAKPVLPRGYGGLSGPAIHPLAVYMIREVYCKVAGPANIPLIGIGGVQFWDDAVEMMLAGASAVAVGTALFVDPQTPQNIIEGMTSYCKRHNISKISDITGQMKPNEVA